MAGDPAGGAEPPTMTMLGLVDEFRSAHFQMPGCKFCFILGAGASVTSGIKSAGTMVGEWIKTIYRQTVGHTGEPPPGWASDATLGITGFDRTNPAASYSRLYHRMYARKPGAGYAYLEAQMEKAEPSFGYAVLGRILAETRHGLVITVNFDNLVADSVSLFTKTYPMVCGHELLLPFMTAQVGRPRVLKVHRDLLLGPKSLPGELDTIDEGLSDTIGRLLTEYTPIVIGYGGNDGSLMGCLKGLKEPLKNGLYWCYRDEVPPQPIREMVARLNGHLVPVMGFDELLMQFGDVLEYPVPHQYVLDRARERADRIVKQAQDLAERIKKHDEAVFAAATAARLITQVADKGGTEGVGAAMSKTMRRKEKRKRWWHWEAEATAEPDTAEREAIYQRAIEALPKSAELLGIYALFLHEVSKAHDAAGVMYERTIAADSRNAINLGNYALFLTDVRKDHDAAGVMYERAVAADPNHANHLGNYAVFLSDVRKDHDAAGVMYERTIAADPNHANHLGNYALFLMDVRKDHDAAGVMYERAVAADPNHANNLCNYARFLTDVRKDQDAAGAMYERAVVADPKNAYILGSYATFLTDVRKDYHAAGPMHERAISANPGDTHYLINYADFLLASGQVEDGLNRLNEVFIRRTGEDRKDSLVACWMLAYCCRPAERRAEALGHLNTIVTTTDVRTGDWDFSGVVAQAVTMKHPEAKWLPKLAEVVAGRAESATLKTWKAWKAAPAADPKPHV